MKASALLPDLLPHAESRLVQTRADLEHFESALYASALPPQYWNQEIRKCVQFVESRYSRAQRDYYRAQASAAAAQPAPARNGKSELPPPAPAPDREPAPLNFQQNIEVSVQDGRAVTRIAEVGNEPWLKSPMLPADTLFCRQVFFKDKLLPDHYAQMMQRLGMATEPVPRVLFLEYTRDSFFDLCRREQEAQCEHLLEGEPVDAWPFI